MSDRELIVNFLEKAAKRAHFNKRFNDIAIALAIAFVVPVLFKLLDLLFLFRGRTVVTFLGLWAVATVVWIVTRLRGKSSLSQVAGSIDSKEHLQDQLKTAYWFIQNPRNSEWVDAQIHHTAKAAGKLRLDSIFPRRFPRATYLACGLLFLTGSLELHSVVAELQLAGSPGGSSVQADATPSARVFKMHSSYWRKPRPPRMRRSLKRSSR